MKQFVSIDIGGTAIKYGIINERGEILRSFDCPTQAHLGGQHILKKSISIVEELQKEGSISGICVSTAGMVNVDSGEIFYAAPLIPDYAGTNFKQAMQTHFQQPCEVENDVNCAGIAESRNGAAKGSSVTLCLTVGTGIGGCILIDGKVFHGAGSSACEVGYMHMDDSNFQTLGATSALCQRVKNMKEAAGQTVDGWNGQEIFEAAKTGDMICTEAIDEMADILGKGIANICYVLNPEVVVLGGGVMAQKEYLLPRIDVKLKKYLVSELASHTVLKAAENGNQAGMLGAFYHFMDRQKK